MANETLNIQNGVSPITIDTEVTEGSMRPVTSDGIYKAIQAGGGGGGLPTPIGEGLVLRSRMVDGKAQWEQEQVHDVSHAYLVDLTFDGEAWTHPDMQFYELSIEYATHSLMCALVNDEPIYLHPVSTWGFGYFTFASGIVPLDSLGLTGMVGFLSLYNDPNAVGGWGIGLSYWAASTM